MKKLCSASSVPFQTHQWYRSISRIQICFKLRVNYLQRIRSIFNFEQKLNFLNFSVQNIYSTESNFAEVALKLSFIVEILKFPSALFITVSAIARPKFY